MFNEYDREQDAYAKQQDAYDRLVSMITTMGYNPSADELTAAGMSAGHLQAYLNYYNMLNMPSVSYSGGGGRKKKKEATEPQNQKSVDYEANYNTLYNTLYHAPGIGQSQKITMIEGALDRGDILESQAGALLDTFDQQYTSGYKTKKK